MISKFGVPLPDIKPSLVQPKTKQRFRVMLFNFGQDINDGRGLSFETESVSKPVIKFETNEYRFGGSLTRDVGFHTWESVDLEIRDSIDNKSIRAVVNQIRTMVDQPRVVGAIANSKFEMVIQTLNGDDTRSLHGSDSLLGVDLEDTIDKYKDKLIDGALTIAAPIAGDLVGSAAGAIGGDLVGGVAGGLAEGFLTPDSAKRDDSFVKTLDTWVLQGCIMTDVDFGEHSYEDAGYVTIKMSILPDNCFNLDDYGQPMTRLNDATSLDNLGNFLGQLGSAVGLEDEAASVASFLG